MPKKSRDRTEKYPIQNLPFILEGDPNGWSGSSPYSYAQMTARLPDGWQLMRSSWGATPAWTKNDGTVVLLLRKRKAPRGHRI